MRRERRRSAAFTLIELMIVIAIIGILASIAIPKFADMLRKALEGKAKGSLGSLRSALTIYYSDMEGLYPCNIAPLTVKGKYLGNIPDIQVPYYHPDDSSYALSVTVSVPPGSTCNPFPQDTLGDTVQHNELTWFAMWGYTQSYWCAGNPPNSTDCDPGNVGNVWINCSHTDTKGTSWDTY